MVDVAADLDVTLEREFARSLFFLLFCMLMFSGWVFGEGRRACWVQQGQVEEGKLNEERKQVKGKGCVFRGGVVCIFLRIAALGEVSKVNRVHCDPSLAAWKVESEVSFLPANWISLYYLPFVSSSYLDTLFE